MAMVFAFSLSMSIPVEAQVESGKIVGTVRDSSGALVPDSDVTVTETQTNVPRMVKTDSNGGYTVTELKPGNYSVTVAHEGFKTAVEAGFKLDVNQVVRADVTLSVGSRLEQIVAFFEDVG